MARFESLAHKSKRPQFSPCRWVWLAATSMYVECYLSWPRTAKHHVIDVSTHVNQKRMSSRRVHVEQIATPARVPGAQSRPHMQLRLDTRHSNFQSSPKWRRAQPWNAACCLGRGMDDMHTVFEHELALQHTYRAQLHLHIAWTVHELGPPFSYANHVSGFRIAMQASPAQQVPCLAQFDLKS